MIQLQVIYEHELAEIMSGDRKFWLALGNFDGVHLAHQYILNDVINKAYIQNCVSGVLLLEPHPEIEFLGRRNFLLTTLEEKIAKIADLGIEYAVLKPFTNDFASLTPGEFAAWLKQKIGVCGVSIGYDYSFGYKGMGTAVSLKKFGENYQFPVSIINPIYWGEKMTVSSELCRKLIKEGKIEEANDMLNAPYQLTGKVIKGEGRGSKLGFPTANMKLPPEKVVPRRGVYIVRVYENVRTFRGICNIGCKPTFQGEDILAETYILDEALPDLYQKEITISIHKFLRPEQKFVNAKQLRQQIALDIEKAKELLASSTN